MADFSVALAELLGEEGGYSNNPHDAGGETVFGIARHYNPHWSGWPRVDELKKQFNNLVELNEQLAADVDLQKAVDDFYRQAYWNFDTIESQLVANKLFGMEVNFGTGSAVRILQQGLIRLGHRLEPDGHLGPATLAALQKAKEPDILHALRAYSALARLQKILAHPDQLVFAEGWFWRDAA